MKRTISIILLVLITIGMILPTAMAASDQVVITYGETTYDNQNYKNIVDNYFSRSASIHEATVKVINADEVNKISSSISKKVYSSSQIFSSALVDLTNGDDLDVEVDKSKITTINEDMYESALESAGITKGHVVVTSPVSSTGESALAGVMGCYEEATGVEVPENVKEAANEEIITEKEIVENSNVTPETLSEVVDEVKEEAEEKNLTNPEQIVPIINNTVINNNLNLTPEDVDKLANTVSDIVAAQDDAQHLEEELSNKINNGQSFIDKIFGFFGL